MCILVFKLRLQLVDLLVLLLQLLLDVHERVDGFERGLVHRHALFQLLVGHLLLVEQGLLLLAAFGEFVHLELAVLGELAQVLHLVLEGDNGLVSLVEAGGEGDHDVALLQQELFLSVYLYLLLFDQLFLLVQLDEFVVVLHLHEFGLLLQHDLELGRVFDLAPSDQQLALHEFQLVIERLVFQLVLFLLLGALLQHAQGHLAVLEGLALLLLEGGDQHLDVVVLLGLGELVLEHGDFVLLLAQEGVLVDVLVDLGVVLDVLCAVGELQRGERLALTVGRGRDHAHKSGLAVATEGVLEDAGDLGVALGDVVAGFLVRKGRDDVAEGTQGLINFLGLFESGADCAGD